MITVNSASYRDAYNAGYNAGYNSGKSSVVATVHLGVWENSDGINGGKHKEDWRTYTKKYGDSSGSGHTKAEGGGEFYISWN